MNWMEKIYDTLRNIERLLDQELSKISQLVEKICKDQEPEPEVWLNPHEVRAHLQYSESTYRRRIRSGRLVGELVDGRRYFKKSEIDCILAMDKKKWKR
jgi:hypothetical protein